MEVNTYDVTKRAKDALSELFSSSAHECQINFWHNDNATGTGIPVNNTVPVTKMASFVNPEFTRSIF